MARKVKENQIIKSLKILEYGNKNVAEFRKKLGLFGTYNDEKYTNLIYILRDAGYIKSIGKKIDVYTILPKGIQLLTNYKLYRLEKSQSKFSKYLLLATFILALGVIMDQIYRANFQYGFIMLLIIMIITTTYLIVLIFKEIIF